ncbi:MAG TPA: hypothetical protein VMF91_03935 [Bryobacteraceae bacterium]|nr:hypothetical protein [Bryobacteraceae bacterium]
MVDALPVIDTPRFSEHLRSRAIKVDSQEVLVTKFEGSEQAEDFTLPSNCGGFGRIHHFRKSQDGLWPPNPLPIEPAMDALGLPGADTLQVQVFQNAVCSWRCWYCFVDFDLLSGNRKFSEFKTADELLDLYLKEPARPVVIDLSGGQPDLVPEWGYWFYRALEARGLGAQVYLWTDDNLSNDYLWRFLNRKQVTELASARNYGRVGCFKGFDEASFMFNTQAAKELFAEQFHLMKRLLDADFDVFGYATFTSLKDTNLQREIKNFVDRLQEHVHPLFPLRTIPLRISEFTPTKRRLNQERERAIAIQENAVAAWLEELKARFPPDTRSRKITEHKVNNRK